MDIAGLAINMNQTQLLTEVKTAVLAKNLDAQEQMKESIKVMMEQSVKPNLGKNIDVSI